MGNFPRFGGLPMNGPRTAGAGTAHDGDREGVAAAVRTEIPTRLAANRPTWVPPAPHIKSFHVGAGFEPPPKS